MYNVADLIQIAISFIFIFYWKVMKKFQFLLYVISIVIVADKTNYIILVDHINATVKDSKEIILCNKVSKGEEK